MLDRDQPCSLRSLCPAGQEIPDGWVPWGPHLKDLPSIRVLLQDAVQVLKEGGYPLAKGVPVKQRERGAVWGRLHNQDSHVLLGSCRMCLSLEGVKDPISFQDPLKQPPPKTTNHTFPGPHVFLGCSGALVLAEIKLIFFSEAGPGLCSGFRVRIVLVAL